MGEQVIIDGNNLWHAMRTHAPIPAPGRETLVKLIDRWAGLQGVRVLIVFDGPPPPDGLVRQMATRRVNVRFSAPQTADDVIEQILRKVSHPVTVRVISSDGAVRQDALKRRCLHTDSVGFVAELFAKRQVGKPSSSARNVRPAADDVLKPENTSDADTADWLRWMNAEDIELPPGWDESGR